MTPDAKTVEWYRPIVTRQMLRVVLPCSLLVLVAAVLIGIGVLREAEDSWAIGLVLVGFVFVIAGPTLAAYGVIRIVQHDVYLAIRTDGVVFHDVEGADTMLTWDAIDEVTVEADGVLALSAQGRPPLRVAEDFIGINKPELAARICELQRKALMGITLRPRSQT